MADALSLKEDLVIGGSGRNDSGSYLDFVNNDWSLIVRSIEFDEVMIWS